MKRYIFVVALLLSAVSAFAQEPMAQCKKHMHDMATVYVYGLVCVDDENMAKVFDNKQNEQAGLQLIEKTQQYCEDADEMLIKEAEEYVLKNDPQLMDILDKQEDVSALCQSKVSLLQRILNSYK